MTRTYTCTYRDGEVVTGLTYEKSYVLFLEAFNTENPCVITVNHNELRVS